MRALVTGGAGFIGSHLCDALMLRGDEVFVIDDLSSGLFRNIAQHKGKPGFRHVIASCADPHHLADAVEWCDVVYHLAAAVGVDLIIAKPVETLETNVQATEVVLRHAARKKKRFIFTSSSEVYGKSAAAPFREDGDAVLGPSTTSRWSYGCSKLVAEFMAIAYMRARQVPVTIFRLFNTVGPRQSGKHGMVLPRFVEQAIAGGPLTVYGDGAQTRCFCDVEDIVRGLAQASTERRTVGEVINLGGREEISIRDLAERVRSLVNPDARIDVVPYEKAYAPGFEDMRRRVPDIAKAGRVMHWSPKVPLDETIKAVAYHMRQAKTARPDGKP